jgi:hypothetical protein
MGITFGIIGPLNTYLRAGKLFPGTCGMQLLPESAV